MADHVRAAQAKRLQRIEIEQRQIADVVDAIGNIGVAESGMIGSDDIEAFRKRNENRLLAGELLRAVQE